MYIALAQLNYHIANFEDNASKIIDAIYRAKKKNADLVVFSELSVCGYPPHDLLEKKDFIEKCEQTVGRIAAACNGIAAIVGSPTINTDPKGKQLYNSAYFLADGKVRHVVHKSLLPDYDIFDEYRYFEPNTDFDIIEYKGKKIALTICEDLWDIRPVENAFGKCILYKVSPMHELSKLDPDMVINISASPYAYTREDIKEQIFIDNAIKYKLPVFVVNQTGGQTDLVFEGGSMAVDANGQIAKKLKYFEEDLVILDSGNMSPLSPPKQPHNTTAMIYDALVLGIKDYIGKTGLQSAVLGLSGGIDSAVTLALAVKALGSDNVCALLMPSKYSSDHSVTDAVALAKNLKVRYEIINIEPVVENYCNSLKPVFKNMPEGITEENIQARIRGNLLMAFSNEYGNILFNTSNKSEAAVGYGTLYGDLSGGLSVLGDVYKTEVFKLARYINRDSEVIPENIITKPPSAELRQDQKDTDSLPEYDILDKILFQYIELNKGAEDIIKQGFDKKLVTDIIRLVNINEYKRYQTPPILRISSKAFGAGRRMPLVAKY